MSYDDVNVEASLKSLDLSIDNLDKEIKLIQLQLKSKLHARDLLFKGRQKMARLAGSSGEQKKRDSVSDEPCFHVSNLNTYTTKKTLIEYFGQFGSVCDVKMTMNGTKNSGEAMVSFSNITDNESLLNFEHFVAGSLLKLQQVHSKSNSNKEHHTKFDEQTRSIMVSGYLNGLNEREIRDHFRQFGEIHKYSDTSKRGNKRNDGYRFVFIKYVDYEGAEKAAAQQNQTVKTFNLTVKKAKDL